MGIKLLSSKKFLILIGILGGLASIITILEFLVKIKVLKPLLNLLVIIINMKIPDIIFIIIILIFIVWLILVSRRLKKLKVAFEEFKKPIPESEKKKDEKFEWNKKHKLLLTLIVEADGEVLSENLYKDYIKVFPDTSKLDFDLNLDDLEVADLIRHPGKAGSSRICIATTEGRRYLRKKLREEKVEKKEEGLKITKEHIYVLGDIAEVPNSISQSALFEPYKKKFPNSFMIDLKSIISDLVKMNYIYRAGSEGGEFFYKATDEGVKFVKKIIEKGRNKENSSKNK